MDRKKLGLLGEDTAAEYLMRDGYRIIERNFKCKLGEIDIIARRGGTLAFVEVKTRQDDFFGRPSEAVGSKKQQHIRRVAEIFLYRKKLNPMKIRFDVMVVEINHIKDAF